MICTHVSLDQQNEAHSPGKMLRNYNWLQRGYEDAMTKQSVQTGLFDACDFLPRI
jgi:hypothetical protein